MSKSITVRLPEEIWKGCVHRMVDELTGWQKLVEYLLTEYAMGSTIEIKRAPGKTPTKRKSAAK